MLCGPASRGRSGSGAVIASLMDVEGARAGACRLSFGALAGAFSSWNEVLRVLVGRAIVAIGHRRRDAIFPGFKCFSTFSPDQSSNVAHELTASLFNAVVPSDKRIAGYQVQNLLVGLRFLNVGGVHLIAAAIGSVDGSRDYFQIVVGKSVSLEVGSVPKQGP